MIFRQGSPTERPDAKSSICYSPMLIICNHRSRGTGPSSMDKSYNGTGDFLATFINRYLANKAC